MKRKGITLFRWGFLIVSFFFLMYGGTWLGSSLDWVKLPVFNCALSPSASVDGICKTIVDPERLFNQASLIPILTGAGICLLLTILFGRLFCGYMCPFGFVQEMLSVIRKKLRIPSIQIPDRYKSHITILKWIMVVGLLLGIGYCELCPIRFIMLPLAGMAGETNYAGILLGAVILGIAFFRERAFCRICPIGALSGLFNRRSLGRIIKKGSACTHCRACIEVCPMDIHEIYEDRKKVDLTNPECIYCMKCIEICPEDDALAFECAGKKIIKSKRWIR